jgi:hypothetical protein
LLLQVEEFVAISSALLINMGTLASDWLAAKKLAAIRVGGSDSQRWVQLLTTVSGWVSGCQQHQLHSATGSLLAPAEQYSQPLASWPNTKGLGQGLK